MFIISVKSDKIKKYILALIAVSIAIIGGVVSVSQNKTATVASIKDISMRAETNEERCAFFKQFGWEVAKEPVEIKETVIPEEFDETYSQYNDIQLSQNLNLEDYKGVRVKAWSYEVLNYPGYESSDSVIRGNLLTYNGTVIGGDICSVELGGFMHGFALPKGTPSASTTTTTAQPSREE